MYFEILKRFAPNGDSLPLLDPIVDMEIEDKNLEKLVKLEKSIY